MRIFLCALLLSFSHQLFAQQPAYSKLWGKKGEAWDTARIPDFRQAGYEQGQPLPRYPVKVNITDFGGKGDGKTDNTQALRQAIAACKENGTLYLPAGTYLISDSIIVRNNSICISGAGKNKTTLFFTKGLEELYPLYNIGTPKQTRWSWGGAMLLFNNTDHSGIRDITIRFPVSLYGGHNFHERAYDAIGFANNARNGWVSDVKIINADLGIWIERSAHHITAQKWELAFGPVRAAQKISGHHGINAYGGYNLFQDFFVNGKYVHDLSVESNNSIFNVFRNGKGKDLCIDHHNHDQSHNLFTNLDAGEGTRLYTSGGKQTPRGVSFHETYWNITARNNNMNYCDQHNSAALQSRDNVAVGIKTQRPSDTANAYGNWFETIDPAALRPKDLYEAQKGMTK